MALFEPDFRFFAGETWTFNGTARDYAGEPFDLSGGVVSVKLQQIGGSGAMDRDALFPDPEAGKWSLVVTPAMQETDGLVAAYYVYTVRATLTSGLVSMQSFGVMEVLSVLDEED